MAKTSYLILCILGVTLSDVYAASDAEKKALGELIADCFSEQGETYEVIADAKKTQSVDNIKPCFLGCALKKVELIDSNGKYTPESGMAALKKIFKSKEDIDKFEEIGKTCLKVKDAAVSDGDAGCERAKLLITCALENKLEVPLN